MQVLSCSLLASVGRAYREHLHPRSGTMWLRTNESAP